MSQVDSAITAKGLSQLQRLTDTFTAPSKTFEDIHSGHRNWWMPLLVLSLVSYMLFGVVVQRVGIRQTIENQMQMSPRAQEQLAQASPEQYEKGLEFWASFTEIMFIGAPVVSLVSAVVIAAVFLGTVNFVFGGRARFDEVLAVTYYAWLPGVIKVLLGIAATWFQAPQTFNIKNFAPTNPAALFLDPGSSNQALYALASQFDVITIWTLVLMSIGVATVAGVKRSAGYGTVFGWWLIAVLCKAGTAALFG